MARARFRDALARSRLALLRGPGPAHRTSVRACGDSSPVGSAAPLESRPAESRQLVEHVLFVAPRPQESDRFCSKSPCALARLPITVRLFCNRMQSSAIVLPLPRFQLADHAAGGLRWHEPNPRSHNRPASTHTHSLWTVTGRQAPEQGIGGLTLEGLRGSERSGYGVPETALQ